MAQGRRGCHDVLLDPLMTNTWLRYIVQQLLDICPVHTNTTTHGHRQEGLLLKMPRTSSYILHSISGIIIISLRYLSLLMSNDMITTAQKGLGPALIRWQSNF